MGEERGGKGKGEEKGEEKGEGEKEKWLKRLGAVMNKLTLMELKYTTLFTSTVISQLGCLCPGSRTPGVVVGPGGKDKGTAGLFLHPSINTCHPLAVTQSSNATEVCNVQDCTYYKVDHSSRLETTHLR